MQLYTSLPLQFRGKYCTLMATFCIICLYDMMQFTFLLKRQKNRCNYSWNYFQYRLICWLYFDELIYLLVNKSPNLLKNACHHFPDIFKLPVLSDQQCKSGDICFPMIQNREKQRKENSSVRCNNGRNTVISWKRFMLQQIINCWHEAFSKRSM